MFDAAPLLAIEDRVWYLFLCSTFAVLTSWLFSFFLPFPRAVLHSAQIKTYKLEPRVAFHIWRPIINDNLMKHWFGKVRLCLVVYCVFLALESSLV